MKAQMIRNLQRCASLDSRSDCG